jgi:hypothetical protein
MEYLPLAERIVEGEFDAECLVAFEKAWRTGSVPAWVKTTPASWAAALSNVHFERCDQSSMQSLQRIGDKHGPFDFVIDDGGHTMKQQITSLATLWPYVKPGGIYVVEGALSYSIASCSRATINGHIE